MSSEENEEPKENEKVKIYINLEPLGLKFGYVFKKQENFQSVINFVYNQVKKLGVKFELGRIVENKTGAILLTENLIGDFLENNEEITVYSDDYGFTRTNFPGDDEHNSLKKIYYLKSVSDLYKSMNFLKKKRNEKFKQKMLAKKVEEKKEKEKENKDNEDDDEKEDKNDKDIKLSEDKEEEDEEKKEQKNSSKNKNINQNKFEKSDKKNKTEKKEKKTEEKDKTAKKSEEKNKTSKKTSEKKQTMKLSSDDEDDE